MPELDEETGLNEPLLVGDETGEADASERHVAFASRDNLVEIPSSTNPEEEERGFLDDDDEDFDEDDDEPPSPPVETFTWRGELAAIWALGWPMGISYACRMGMASTDSIMVGHLKDGGHDPGTYLAASALSDMVTTLLVVPPLAFNQVLNALCGQAVGSGRKKMAGVWLQQSCFWLALGMLPFLSGFFFVDRILHALGFDRVICELAGSYARWNIFWPIPNGWYQCMRFYFQAVGKPRPAMYNSVFFLFVNALLNWVFVFGGPFRHARVCGWDWSDPDRSVDGWRGFGFIGAAISLSFSRCLQPLAYWLYMFVWKREHADFWPGWRWEEHTKARTLEFLKQGLPLVGTLVFGAVVGQATTLLVSRLGTDAVAATTAVSTATVVWAGAINAMFSMVIAVRVGYHLGRGDGDAARDSFWVSTALVFTILACVIACVLPFTEETVGLTTSDRVVVRNAAKVLPAALFATLLGVLNSLCTGGVFSGQGRQMLVTFLSFAIDIPLSIGGVAVVVLCVRGANLEDVYLYQVAAAVVELMIAYVFIFKSDWRKLSEEALARQTAR